MNILVTNDDGIHARGIHELVETLASKASVYVCAPDGQRSASGHSITILKDITVSEMNFEGATRAFAISGTPADCVKLGMGILAEQNVVIDMVFSGINHGGNLGTDTLYSGTVSAALEGSICGVPSAALSVNSHGATHFEYICDIALDLVTKAYGKLPADVALNINSPDLPPEEIRGLRLTTLGKREYENFFIPVDLADGTTGYRYSGDPVVYEGLPDSIDVVAMQEGYATITPIHFDLTAYEMMDEIKKWKIGE